MRIICFILMYLSIFKSINFTTNKFLEIGILLLPIQLIYVVFKRHKIILSKKLIKYYILCGNFFVIHFLTKIINDDFNLASGVFINFIYRIISNFISAVIIVNLIYKFEKRNKEKYLIKMYINAILLDLFLGLVVRIYPKLIPIFVILNKQNLSLELFQTFGSYRIIGLGTQFFSTGVVVSSSLILITYILNKENTLKNWIIYFFSATIGLLSARTTLVGIGLSLIYYFKQNIFKVRKYILGAIVFLGVIVIVIGVIDKNSLKWAFQIFINKGRTTSTDTLKEMWYIIPEELKTFIIGDGKWITKEGYYYMGTDVGYLRILWYSGMIGIFNFLIFSILLFLQIKNKEKRKLSKYLLILFLILNIKGHVEPFFIIYCLIILEIEEWRKGVRSKCSNVRIQ